MEEVEEEAAVLAQAAVQEALPVPLQTQLHLRKQETAAWFCRCFWLEPFLWQASELSHFPEGNADTMEKTGNEKKRMSQEKQLYNKIAAGKRIRSSRERLGLSRQRMAEQIGKAEKYYADIERGYCEMSLETMIEIAGCLGITLDYMIFGEDEKGQELPEDSRSILFSLGNCDEKKRKKAMELLRVYLSE